VLFGVGEDRPLDVSFVQRVLRLERLDRRDLLNPAQLLGVELDRRVGDNARGSRLAVATEMLAAEQVFDSEGQTSDGHILEFCCKVG
jgi:hypothetical protein